MGYYSTTIENKKVHIYDTQGTHSFIDLVASSRVKTLSTLYYQIDKARYKEELRINAAIFDMGSSTHQGWEFSDTYETACPADERADIIVFKDGTCLVGDIDKNDIDTTQIAWAFSGAEVVLKDGENVSILAHWRDGSNGGTDYRASAFLWSFIGYRPDKSFIFGSCHVGNPLKTSQIRTWLRLQGCTDAIICDGGGSTEMIYEGNIMNGVTSERAIANGVFVYEDTQYVEPENGLQERINELEAQNEALNKRLSDKDKAIQKALEI